MCALVVLENDLYMLILLRYEGYERRNRILCLLKLIQVVIIISII